MKNYFLYLSPQIIEHKKDQEIYDDGNPSSDFRQALKVAEPNQLMAIRHLPLLIIGSQIAIQGSPWS